MCVSPSNVNLAFLRFLPRAACPIAGASLARGIARGRVRLRPVSGPPCMCCVAHLPKGQVGAGWHLRNLHAARLLWILHTSQNLSRACGHVPRARPRQIEEIIGSLNQIGCVPHLRVDPTPAALAWVCSAFQRLGVWPGASRQKVAGARAAEGERGRSWVTSRAPSRARFQVGSDEQEPLSRARPLRQVPPAPSHHPPE